MKGGRKRQVEEGEIARMQKNVLRGKKRRKRVIKGEQRSNRNKRKQNTEWQD